jgi:glycerophosphoryl diester phosphodiesterase
MTNRSFPLICAHTGCGAAPDNTLASFMESIALSADVAEVDLRVTEDGTVVLMHDDSPLLHELSFEQLNRLENRIKISVAYETHTIATLDEVLGISRENGIKLNLDIKTEAVIAPVIRSIRHYEMEDLVFITGCSDGITDSHRGIKVLYNTPDVLTSEVEREYAAWAHTVCEWANASGYYGLNMNYRTCRRELVEYAHMLGLVVWVYTVDDEESLNEMIRLGVDEITTNEVELLKQLKTEIG